MIAIGIGTHKATLAVHLADELGRELARTPVPNDHLGHRRLLDWALGLGPERRFGIEGSGSFGAALAQSLFAAGELALEVPATLTDRERRHFRQRGKSCPADALAIARLAVRESSLRRVPLSSLADDLKLVVTARDELAAERTRVREPGLCRPTRPRARYGERIPKPIAARHLAAVAWLLGRSTTVRAGLARSRLAHLRAIDREVTGLEVRLASLVAARAAGPRCRRRGEAPW